MVLKTESYSRSRVLRAACGRRTIQDDGWRRLGSRDSPPKMSRVTLPIAPTGVVSVSPVRRRGSARGTAPPRRRFARSACRSSHARARQAQQATRIGQRQTKFGSLAPVRPAVAVTVTAPIFRPIRPMMDSANEIFSGKHDDRRTELSDSTEYPEIRQTNLSASLMPPGAHSAPEC